MADNLPTNNNAKLLGGVNLKSSEYSLSKLEFLNLRNLDFDVPNALSKRPGSTQAIGLNTSGPILSMHEFVNLQGASTVVVASNQALFYMNGASLNILDQGWSNGQPPDMLTFVNKEWIANGSKFYGWSGIGSTLQAVGLPCAYYGSSALFTSPDSGGASIYTVAGATMLSTGGSSFLMRGVFLAYSYVRKDGYFGPADLTNARNVVSGAPGTSGEEYFTSWNYASNVFGFTTAPSGVSAIAIWIAVDTVTPSSPAANIPVVGNARVGDLGFKSDLDTFLMAATLKPGADTSRFHLYTLIAPGSFLLDSSVNPGVTMMGFTLWQWSFNSYTGVATNGRGFTGIPFCWFETNVPKYIDVNQNSMFMAGFSSNPSNVWFSELGQPENIQPENFFEVRTNDGDRVYGIKAFNNTVVILKQNSFHKVVGDSPENFELIELSGEYGCISNQTIIEYQEKLVWLDQKGIVQYNGSGWDIISNQVEDMFRRMNLEAAKEKACAVHQIYRNQVWWGIPIDGSTENNLTVVYDYLVNAWTFFDGFNPSTFGFVKAHLNKPTVWRGTYSGMIHFFGESFLGDNGQGISTIFTPHWDKNKENETWIWRRSFLDVNTATGLTGQITAKVFSDYNLNTVQGTFSMFQNAFQSRAEMGVVGKAVTAEFAHYSASLPLLVNSYSWAKRYLRNV